MSQAMSCKTVIQLTNTTKIKCFNPEGLSEDSINIMATLYDVITSRRAHNDEYITAVSILSSLYFFKRLILGRTGLTWDISTTKCPHQMAAVGFDAWPLLTAPSVRTLLSLLS